MSKIGRTTIPIANVVTVDINGDSVVVKGPKGQLSHTLPPGIKATLQDSVLTITRSQDTLAAKSLHGLTRAILANMVKGVETEFSKVLELVGTGYRARLNGRKLVLSVGYSHEIEYEIPEGLNVTLEGTNLITIKGIDKHLVGQVAANIRAYKKPEPYKGKGIKYLGEVVRRKAGKAAKAAA